MNSERTSIVLAAALQYYYQDKIPAPLRDNLLDLQIESLLRNQSSISDKISTMKNNHEIASTISSFLAAKLIAPLLYRKLSTTQKTAITQPLVSLIEEILNSRDLSSQSLFERLSLHDQRYLLQGYGEVTVASYKASNEAERAAMIALTIKQRHRTKPYSQSQNTRLLNGNSIYLSSLQQLFLLIQYRLNYLFDYGDIDYLLTVALNPFSGRVLTTQALKKLQELKETANYLLRPYPLDQVLQGRASDKQWCPSSRIAFTSTPLDLKQQFVFLRSIKALSDGELLERLGEAEFNYDHIQIELGYVYKITLGQALSPREIYPIATRKVLSKLKSASRGGVKFITDRTSGLLTIAVPKLQAQDVVKIELLIDSYRFRLPHSSRSGIRIEDESILQALTDNRRVLALHRTFLPAMAAKIKALGLVENHPIKLYRGLTGLNTSAMEIGQSLTLNSEKYQSWTTDSCVAEDYASWSQGFSAIVSRVFQADELLIDSRFLNIDQIRENTQLGVWGKYHIFEPRLNEILSYPGSYLVKLERLMVVRGVKEPNVYLLDERADFKVTTGYNADGAMVPLH